MEYSADLKAFNQLFADYQGRFIRFANIYVRDIAVAEDFTIEALMQYWENRNTLKADSNVPAYIQLRAVRGSSNGSIPPS